MAHWSISAIDLDSLRARMCAAQVLYNVLLHCGSLGEFVVYLTPDIVLPAR